MALYKGYTTSSIMGAIADGVLLGSTDDNLILTPNANGTWHLGFSGTIYCDFVPYTNNINFGSSSNRFKNIYATNINASGTLTAGASTLASATISGNASMGASSKITFGSSSYYLDKNNYTGLAAKATADADGNNIKTTYSKERYTTITLAVSDWSSTTFNSEPCFRARKPLTGASNSTSHAIVAPYTTNQELKDDEQSAFALIYDSYCEDNYITFYATEKPEIAFTVQVKGW